MRNRPVSSPFRRLTGTVLSLLAFSLVSAAQAEESRSPPLLSLLFSSLQKEEARRKGDVEKVEHGALPMKVSAQLKKSL